MAKKNLSARYFFHEKEDGQEFLVIETYDNEYKVWGLDAAYPLMKGEYKGKEVEDVLRYEAVNHIHQLFNLGFWVSLVKDPYKK